MKTLKGVTALHPHDFAYAVDWDAGNRSMRRGGRSVWDKSDRDACVDAWDAVHAAVVPSHPVCGPRCYAPRCRMAS